MRENIKNISLILAVIIAGISLPTALISMSKNPTIINNYTENYYFNQTYYYGGNETEIIEIDYTRPLEVFEYTNLTINEYFADLSYNLTNMNTIYIASNITYDSFRVYFVLDSMIDYFYDGYRVWVENNCPNEPIFWSPPSYGLYHFIFKNEWSLSSVKVFLEIL